MTVLPVTDARAVAPALASRFTIPWWYGALLVGALLLANQPYRGVRHDALLYLGQALVRLDPSWWHSDVYFAFGSQDRYSVFSRLFVKPVAWLGIPAAEMLALTVGRIATFVALYLLVDRWPAHRRWLALAAVAGSVHYYGGKTFAVLEPFVTARTFAEPLSLLAVAAVIHGRKGWGALALAAAMAAHPLIALPVAVVIWIYLVVFEDRRWVWAAATLVPVFLLGYAGVAPFDGLLRRYDDEWFTIVGFLDAQAFVSEWSFRVYVAILGYATIVWLATWGRRDALARFSRVAVSLGPVCCALSFYIADWEHNVLLTQLQFWRVIWVGELLTVLWAPMLVLDCWRRGATGRVAAAAVCAGFPVVQDDMGIYGWAILVWIAFWAVASRRRLQISRGLVHIAFVATIAMGIVAVGQHCWDALYQLRSEARGVALTYPASIPFRVVMLTLPFFGLLLTAWQRSPWRPVCATAAALLFAAAAWQADQRDAFTRFVESATTDQRPFQREIPSTAHVYWEGDQTAPVWMLLHRAGFALPGQFSGVIFNRRTAMVGRDIYPFLSSNMKRGENCSSLQSWMSQEYTFSACFVSAQEMRARCTWAGPHPDFIVSPGDYAMFPHDAKWTFRPTDGSPPTDYYLYSCRALQAAPSPSSSAASK